MTDGWLTLSAKNKKKHTLKGLIITEREAKSGHYITFYNIHSAQLAETWMEHFNSFKTVVWS